MWFLAEVLEPTEEVLNLSDEFFEKLLGLRISILCFACIGPYTGDFDIFYRHVRW